MYLHEFQQQNTEIIPFRAVTPPIKIQIYTQLLFSKMFFQSVLFNVNLPED